MSPTNRTVFGQALALGVAVLAFGVSYGVLAVAAGMSVVMTVAMSLLVFAGGAQFAAVGIIAAGGSPWAAVLPGLLLNTRFVPLGLVVAPLVGGSIGRRLLASQIVTDESVAMAAGQPDPDTARRSFWVSGVTLVVAWLAGSLIGALLGAGIGDPATYGLDAAFPAGFLALLSPLVRTRRQRVAAVAGALIAVAATPLLPLGLPIVLAALGALAALPVPAPKQEVHA
jgi:4-azaleucine resistance transporter AzlC